MPIEPVEVTEGAGTPVAMDLVGADYYQVVKLDFGGDGAAIPALVEAFHGVSGTSLNAASATGAGTAIGSGGCVLTEHAMRVTHDATTLTVDLEGLFGSDWQMIGQWKHTERASGSVLVVRVPTVQLRANITTISGAGADATAHITSK